MLRFDGSINGRLNNIDVSNGQLHGHAETNQGDGRLKVTLKNMRNSLGESSQLLIPLINPFIW